jgi:DNA polymerase-3 subunit epsilon
MTTIWFCDTETGGFDADLHSILSVALVKWVDGHIECGEEWLIREDPFVVTGEAMSVNQLNLSMYESWWEPRSAATDILHSIADSPESPPILGGHNTPFDIRFVKRLFRIAQLEYPFSYHYEDTLAVARFLRSAGYINPPNVRLETLCEYFGLGTTECHTALGDARATAEVYTRFLKMVKGKA